ncbi:MAG: hypothetical protein ACRDOH_34885, partial [Streptosporangiaceae bacterium]
MDDDEELQREKPASRGSQRVAWWITGAMVGWVLLALLTGSVLRGLLCDMVLGALVAGVVVARPTLAYLTAPRSCAACPAAAGRWPGPSRPGR